MNLSLKNIENLTALWKTVGNQFNGFQEQQGAQYSEVKDTQWPNRIWFHNKVNQEKINDLKNNLKTITSNMTIPIWNIYSKNDTKIIEENGFNLKFEQVGMSLKLETSFELQKDFRLILVTNTNEANIWAKLFEKSFGYVIGSKTVESTLKTINYYIAFDGNLPIGTALSFETNNTIGVHSVGIPPKNRRLGYAEQIMKHLINQAVKNNNDYMVLQASEMGKGLYQKLGFKSDFMIRYYTL